MITCSLYSEEEWCRIPHTVGEYQSPTTPKRYLVAPLSWTRRDLYLIDFLNMTQYGALSTLLDFHIMPPGGRQEEEVGVEKKIILVIHLQRSLQQDTGTESTTSHRDYAGDYAGTSSSSGNVNIPNDLDKNFLGQTPPYRIEKSDSHNAFTYASLKEGWLKNNLVYLAKTLIRTMRSIIMHDACASNAML